jgi:hypothetical protein
MALPTARRQTRSSSARSITVVRIGRQEPHPHLRAALKDASESTASTSVRSRMDWRGRFCLGGALVPASVSLSDVPERCGLSSGSLHSCKSRR